MSFYEEYSCTSDLWCVKDFPLTLLQLQEGVKFDLSASFNKSVNSNNNNYSNNSSLYLPCTLFSLYLRNLELFQSWFGAVQALAEQHRVVFNTPVPHPSISLQHNRAHCRCHTSRIVPKLSGFCSSHDLSLSATTTSSPRHNISDPLCPWAVKLNQDTAGFEFQPLPLRAVGLNWENSLSQFLPAAASSPPWSTGQECAAGKEPGSSLLEQGRLQERRMAVGNGLVCPPQGTGSGKWHPAPSPVTPGMSCPLDAEGRELSVTSIFRFRS